MTTDATLAVRTRGLTKHYRRRPVVDAVDLEVPTGAVYGFLGPNGSGKTTTLRLLLGLLAADAGEIAVLGTTMPDGLRDVLPRVGALVEGPGLHRHLSAAANLARLDAAEGHSGRGRQARIAQALDRVGLGSAAGVRVGAFSLGMTQRLGLAAALLHPRELLVLDEPTNGLDPQGTREVRGIVGELAGSGVTVLLSSHHLGEVAAVCSHVGVMSAGRLVAQGRPEDVLAAPTRVRISTSRPASASAVLLASGLRPVSEEASVVAPLRPEDGDGRALVERLVVALVEAGVPVRGIEVEAASLEDAFVTLTGEGFDVAG